MLGIAIFAHLFISTFIERWCGNIEVTILNNLRHKAIKECHNERIDVRTIDISIGHYDDFIVAKFINIGLSVVFSFNTKAHTYALNDVHYRLSFEHSMPLYLLNVEDFTT